MPGDGGQIDDPLLRRAPPLMVQPGPRKNQARRGPNRRPARSRMADALARPSGNAATKRRSSNPGRAAMTGASLLHSGLTGAAPFTTFGVPLAGPAIGALLHTLQTKPGFNYDPQGAGKEASRYIRRLGSIYPKTKADKRRALMMPSLDEQVGDSGRTGRQLQEEHTFHPGGPLAFALAHREHLDPEVQKPLAGAIPEGARVHFPEVGKGGNRFTDVMLDGSRISRTPGHRLPVDDVFGFSGTPRPTVNPGWWR
jgi:hypothetical protein